MAILQLNGISKNFGAIQALDGVSLELNSSEILGRTGDNGAGKSTLVKIIAGNFKPTKGTITIAGEHAEFHRPVDARNRGVEIVYQDLVLCNNLSVAVNVFLGRELTAGLGPFRIMNYAAMNARAGELFKELKSQNLAVILTSHRMPDVFAVADRIAVLRRGRKVADKPVGTTSPKEIMGGAGTVFGAVVGAALIEVIRNSLTLLGISSFWQGAFVGSLSFWPWPLTGSGRTANWMNKR